MSKKDTRIGTIDNPLFLPLKSYYFKKETSAKKYACFEAKKVEIFVNVVLHE